MNQPDQINSKILSEETLSSVINEWKNNNQSIVFTNGCFDILHRGHVTYLSKASELGDKLIIGVNSDTSVKALEKGSNRPVNPEMDRAYLLAALSFVDAVIVFNESTPLELISTIYPNVLVKGGDYNVEETEKNNPGYIVGSDIVKNSGGKVEAIKFVEGYSTSSIINKFKT